MRRTLHGLSATPALLLLAACATSAPAATAPPTPAAATPDRTGVAAVPLPGETEVDALMTEYDRADSPGAVVGVIEDGKVVFAKGYGMANLPHSVPITPDTRFNVGSIAKQFTAFALALLESRGQLSIDDPARRYLPELPEFDEVVTLRHLLTHTSGYRETYGMSAFAGYPPDEAVLTREGALRVVERQPELEFAPGSRYQYNSSAYVLLALVIERVTGEPFPQWMRANVFDPLGMDRTVIEEEIEQVIPGAADSYTDGESGGYRTAFSNRAYHGAADVYTTVGDMAHWLDNFDTAKVGGRRVIDRMLERFVLTSGDTLAYALGVNVDEWRGLRRIQHSGSHAGYLAWLSYFPDLDAGVVVMSNYDEMSGSVARRVAEIFFGEHMERTTADSGDEGVAGQRYTWVPDDAQLREFSGRYFSEEAETFYTLEVRDGTLVAAHRLNGDVRLRPAERDVFTGIESPLRLVFERDQRGVVTGYRASLYRTTGVWFERQD